jgi:hypothetical protein
MEQGVAVVRQKYGKADYTVDDLYQILLLAKKNGTHDMWTMWEIVKAANPKSKSPDILVWFECGMCGNLLAPSNPSRTYKDHYGHLKETGVCSGRSPSEAAA